MSQPSASTSSRRGSISSTSSSDESDTDDGGLSGSLSMPQAPAAEGSAAAQVTPGASTAAVRQASQFDPTAPGSQILSRKADTAASPTKHRFPLPRRGYTVPSSSTSGARSMFLSRPQDRPEEVESPGGAGKGKGKERFGGMALAADREAEALDGDQGGGAAGGPQAAAVDSTFMGATTAQQTFLQMINALAASEPDPLASDEESERNFPSPGAGGSRPGMHTSTMLGRRAASYAFYRPSVGLDTDPTGESSSSNSPTPLTASAVPLPPSTADLGLGLGSPLRPAPSLSAKSSSSSLRTFSPPALSPRLFAGGPLEGERVETTDDDLDLDDEEEASYAAQSSSIHAIHRPLEAARIRRSESLSSSQFLLAAAASPPPVPFEIAEPDQAEESEASSASRGDERERAPVKRAPAPSRSQTVDSRVSGVSTGTGGQRRRRERLAEKLEDIFAIEGLGAEKIFAEWQCWMFRTVLLQGFMYLTSSYMLFYAYLPAHEGSTIRSGGLGARGKKTRRYYKHWFVLRDAVLAWFPSSTEPYFPDGQIDLHYCVEVAPSEVHPTHFKVRTADKKWHFRADSKASRDEWVKTLRKVVFRCQNEGESVKIAIPWETVVDIDTSSSLEFAETIRVRVYDASEGYSVDEYWLSYFSDIEGALGQMRAVLEDFRARNGTAEVSQELGRSLEASQETNEPSDRPSSLATLQPVASSASQEEPSQSSTGQHSKSSSTSWGSSISSRLKLFSSAPSSGPERSAVAAAQATVHASLADIVNLVQDTSPAKRASSTKSRTSIDSTRDIAGVRTSLDVERPIVESPVTTTKEDDDHTYPPEPSPAPPPAGLGSDSNDSAWTLPGISSLPAIPTWLKNPPRKLFNATTGGLSNFVPRRQIVEVVSSSSELPEEKEEKGEVRQLADADLEPKEEEEDGTDKEKGDKFRRLFGMKPTEVLLHSFPTYLFRGLPIYGKLYVSTNFLCFKSIGLLASTKMVLPLADVIGVAKQRSYRIGFYGLMVVIKGHEEIFFELSSSDRRDACLQAVEAQVDSPQAALQIQPEETLELQQHLDLLHLSSQKEREHSRERPLAELPTPSQPPIMFSSMTSDYVTFQPDRSLRFTCMAIGSRGDVQPYIALCKGLVAAGHTCKIASHEEYRGWVEGHGIGFAGIGGDPAELMQLMIAHDFFTIAFMKEAVSRFRGWLDDLLETSWAACQDTDVLIESPSTIAGLHIAEALRVPYFRAFTMPWTRTRAYPHAFAVPEVKMGGSYNYMTYTMFDHVFWRATAAQINRWRKNLLGLGPTGLDQMQQQKIPFLYNFSPSIVPPPLDWRENIHVTGYWWLDNPDDSNAAKWQPPPALVAFLDEAKELGKKLVFIGFGSIIIPDPQKMTRIVTEAVEQAEVYAIVAKGWSDRVTSALASDQEKKELEDQEREDAAIMARPFIFNVKTIPHDWLFPRIDAAVHHGGAGTTGASLRAGLPTIISPFFGDQHFWADRVATLGIGASIRTLTTASLSEAIRTAVTDERQIARAREVGVQLRKEKGVDRAIECIYRDLEYARSLIPPLPPRPDTPTLSPALRTLSPRGSEAYASKNTSSDESWDVMSRASVGDHSNSGDADHSSRWSSSKSPSRRLASRSSRGTVATEESDEDLAEEGL